MKRTLKILLPILLVLVILASMVWYLFAYDRGTTLELLLRQARYWEEHGKHGTAAWFYDLAYKQSGNDEDVAIELAQRFKAIGNYTKAEYTLSNAIADGGGTELYVALCKTYVEQDKLLDAVTMLDNISDPTVKAALDGQRPAAPATDTAPGLYNQYLDVHITAESGTLYLTSNGEYPSTADGPSDGTVSLPGGETTIYAVAVGENGLVSPVSIFGYTVGGVIEQVSFADEAIEQTVRQLLNVGQDTVLYTDDLWTIREFTAPEDAAHYEDIAKMPYLVNLTLPACTAEDMSFLSGLGELETLSLSKASVSAEGLATIAALPKLQTLSLTDCALSNIDALAAAQQLRSLDLSQNAIRDLDALSGMTLLEELGLSHNALTSLLPISGLSALRELDVSHNALTSLAPVSACTALTQLNAAQNKITALGALDNLSALRELDVSGNALTDVSVLAGCTALETLSLANNQVSNITGLGGVRGLRNLDFSYNQVAVLPEFASDAALSDINGAYNQLASLDVLGGLPNLNKVTMDYNTEISSVTALAQCPVLVQVSVFGTKVTDVSALTALSVIVSYDPTQTAAETTAQEE